MNERQRLIAQKLAVQSAKNKLRQMRGIEVLEIFGENLPSRLNEMCRAYRSTFGHDAEPYSRISCKSPDERVFTWIENTLELEENREYFFFCGVWTRIKLLDLRLAVSSLWRQDEHTKGFLLAEPDLSRMLEAGSDSRDENNYLIDIWSYDMHGG